MNNDEMQKNIEFIISQQAQFSVDIQQLKEAQVHADARMTRIEGAVVTIVDLVGQLARSTASQIAELVEAQKRTDEALARTNAALAETDERLNSLIVVVERYFTNGHKGDQ
jgi:hypothetical protein